MVAASVALASLLRGEFDGACARICWRWALPGWSALTAGIILVPGWAYCELGWGRRRLWDPVENASLLPWLSATALLHSLSLTRQREIFRHSSLLAIVTLMLSLLGTLIVRSGILVSVHAFALDNVRAVPLFSLFALISLASLALYGWRARDGGPVVRFSGLSREMLILATLLLFCAVLLIVLVGTLYPMIYGLLGWGRLSVGAPYFNRATFTVWPVDAGGDCAGDVCLWQTRAAPGAGSSCGRAVICRWDRGFQRQPSGDQPEFTAGSAGDAGRITFRFERLDLQAKGNYTSEKAIVALFDHQQRIGELMPERRFYEARRQQMMEPSIRWNGIHDWYAVMGEKPGSGSLRFSLVCTKRCALDLGGRIVDDCGRIVKRMAGEEAR